MLFYLPALILLSSFVASNSYLRSSFFFRNRSADSKECSSNGLIGQCMFTFECMQHRGRPIAICMERYFVGSCCHFNISSNVLSQEDEKHYLQHTNDYSSTDSTSPTNAPNLRKIEQPNSNTLIVTKRPSTTAWTKSAEKKKLAYGSSIANQKAVMHSGSQNATSTSNEKKVEESETINFINSTNLQNKLNSSEQTKPINLIELSTSSNVLNKLTAINNSVNYLSTTNNLADNLTNNVMSGLYGISAIISELSKYHTKQSATSPIAFNENSLIDQNFTNNRMTTLNDALQTTGSIVTTTDKSTTAVNRLPIEQFFKDQECGIQPIKRSRGRVVGGENSEIGQWPWMVLIKESTWFGYYIKSKCGGVLISPSWVLTAAHCNPQILGSLFVILDQLNSNDNPKSVVRAVKRMIIHRDYNPNTFENDIALLELSSPIEKSGTMTPICLPNKETDHFDEAIVAGYGKLKYGGSIPSILQVAKLPILSNKNCQEIYLEAGHNKKIRDTFLCAGYKNSNQQESIKDTCEGDSGSPLMARRESDGRWVLLATVSHGIKCSYLPGIYMRTTSYLTWIQNVMSESNDLRVKKIKNIHQKAHFI